MARNNRNKSKEVGKKQVETKQTESDVKSQEVVKKQVMTEQIEPGVPRIVAWLSQLDSRQAALKKLAEVLTERSNASANMEDAAAESNLDANVNADIATLQIEPTKLTESGAESKLDTNASANIEGDGAEKTEEYKASASIEDPGAESKLDAAEKIEESKASANSEDAGAESKLDDAASCDGFEGAEPPRTSVVTVEFEVECQHTVHGEHLVVTGGDPSAGSWIPHESQIRLETCERRFPLWEGTAQFPAGQHFEFKFVKLDPGAHGKYHFEHDVENRKLDVPAEGKDKVVVKAVFNKQEMSVAATGGA